MLPQTLLLCTVEHGRCLHGDTGQMLFGSLHSIRIDIGAACNLYANWFMYCIAWGRCSFRATSLFAELFEVKAIKLEAEGARS